MDKDGRNVEYELRYNDSFSSVGILKEWLDNVLKYQRLEVCNSMLTLKYKTLILYLNILQYATMFQV